MTTIDRQTDDLRLRTALQNGRDLRVEPGLSLTHRLGSGGTVAQNAKEQPPPSGDAHAREARSIDRIGAYLAGAAAGVWWKDRAKKPRITISRAGSRLSITFVAVDGVGLDDICARLRELVDETVTMMERDSCRTTLAVRGNKCTSRQEPLPR